MLKTESAIAIELATLCGLGLYIEYGTHKHSLKKKFLAGVRNLT